jgi:SAM-dependent methyltransferase
VTTPRDLLALAPRLRESFRSAGYTVDGVGALLGDLATAALGRDDRVPALAAAGGSSQLDVLIRLFLLGLDEPAEAARFLPDAVLVPVASGSGTGERVRAGIDLRPHDDDWWVAADFARAHPPPADHVIGIGAASMTLLEATLRGPVARALDLGTGCGIQALHLTRLAERVTATDAVPRAVDMARLTFALSGFAPEAVELLCGDLLAPVAERQFELIVSNPPFVLAPVEPEALAYRDAAGGDDSGLARVLDQAAGALATGGVAQVLTSWVVPPDGDWQQRVGPMLPGGCDALVVLRELLDPAEHVALWRDDAEAEPAATARSLRWLAHLEGLGAEGIAYGLIVLRRTDAAPRIRMVDLRSEPRTPSGERLARWLDRSAVLSATDVGDLHLRAVAGLRLGENSTLGEDGWETRERYLSCADALPETVAVDPLTTTLMAGSDGQLPMRAVAELLAVATGAPASRVLRVAAQLLETGHLVPVIPARSG